MAGIYASLDWYNMQCRITRLPGWSGERDAGQARLDRVEGEVSRRTGPSRTTSQSTVGGPEVPLSTGYTHVSYISHRFTLPL